LAGTKRAAAPDFFKATSKRNVQGAHNDPAATTLMAAAAAGC
jgi:hypothetical protein